MYKIGKDNSNYTPRRELAILCGKLSLKYEPAQV